MTHAGVLVACRCCCVRLCWRRQAAAAAACAGEKRCLEFASRWDHTAPQPSVLDHPMDSAHFSLAATHNAVSSLQEQATKLNLENAPHRRSLQALLSQEAAAQPALTDRHSKEFNMFVVLQARLTCQLMAWVTQKPQLHENLRKSHTASYPQQSPVLCWTAALCSTAMRARWSST